MTSHCSSVPATDGIGSYALGQVAAHRADERDNVTAVMALADAVCSTVAQTGRQG